MEVTIGGERLGAGKKMKASFNNYERSTHDLSYIWRSTMSAGTLVPFMSELALPGDTFDINLGCSVLTHPTIGPLFGSYKIQLDVFQVPIRLYHAALHMNMLDIGMKMSSIKLPQMTLTAENTFTDGKDLDNSQINPSSIFSYLNIRGLGLSTQGDTVERKFNAIPYLAYWDIYKQYYANKQEEIGAMIHVNGNADPTMVSAYLYNIQLVVNGNLTSQEIYIANPSATAVNVYTNPSSYLQIEYGPHPVYEVYLPNILLNVNGVYTPITKLFRTCIQDREAQHIRCYGVMDDGLWVVKDIKWVNNAVDPNGKPTVFTFDLAHIDQMRSAILQANPMSEFDVNSFNHPPYQMPLIAGAAVSNQEGLALKTYQSDLFNNWISTEWIDGVDGIAAVTAVSTAGDSFTIDELNLSKKIYDMLNRIALSGGTYDDWLDAVYTHDRTRSQENPAYLGGLIKELVFQEVVSNSATSEEPLGSLAGRGVLSQKHKGGHIIAKIDEPSYILGIISITPRVDYSQGNKWDVNLKTMDDFHKPALDQIGFQDLITDQMAWFDTRFNSSGVPVFKSAGKQPAWINYMTNVNQVRGNFAIRDNQMFMTLNRRYEAENNGDGTADIMDLTTYIDPSKFNHVFAQTSLDAQNFWTQISLDITARRKMSSKIIPNL